MALKKSSELLVSVVYYFIGIIVFNVAGAILGIFVREVFVITDPVILWVWQYVWFFISVLFSPLTGALYIKNRYLIKDPAKVALFATIIYVLGYLYGHMGELANNNAAGETLYRITAIGASSSVIYYLSSRYFIKKNLPDGQNVPVV